MIKHEFIFKPGQWIGEGKITINVSPERLRFYTRWLIDPIEAQSICCQQHVEMEGRDENVFNRFLLSEINDKSFKIEFTSELLGILQGKGIIDAKTIAWEFRGYSDFEGFEVYELQPDGDYMMHAEYASSENFRTTIDGRIWKKLENK